MHVTFYRYYICRYVFFIKQHSALFDDTERGSIGELKIYEAVISRPEESPTDKRRATNERGLSYFLRKSASNKQMGRIVLPFYDSYGVYPSLLTFVVSSLSSYNPYFNSAYLSKRGRLLRPPESPWQGLSAGRAVNYQEGILIKFFMVAGRLQYEGLT